MDFESNILNPDIYHDIMNWIGYIEYDIIWSNVQGTCIIHSQGVNVSDMLNLTSIDVYRLDHYKYQFNNVIIVLDT